MEKILIVSSSRKSKQILIDMVKESGNYQVLDVDSALQCREIIKKLERIKYININNKTQIITPTEKGEKIFDIVYSSMPDMLNPKLTASWEKGLDMVAKKEIKSDELMTKLEKYIHSKIDKLVVKM